MSINFAFFLISISAVLDIAANLFLEKSDGFKHKKFGIPAIFFVCLAYTLLAQVTQTVDLTVAYVVWGAMAIFGTVMMARIMFNQKLNWRGWLGLVIILLSIIVLKTA
jgi:spermidine export protein MdtI